MCQLLTPTARPARPYAPVVSDSLRPPGRLGDGLESCPALLDPQGDGCPASDARHDDTNFTIFMRLRPAGRKARILKTCTVEIGRLHFDADRSLGRQAVVCVMRSVRARGGDCASTALQHDMLIAVGVCRGGLRADSAPTRASGWGTPSRRW